MQTTTDKLIATKDNGIGWITFNNPAPHNAVNEISAKTGVDRTKPENKNGSLADNSAA